ncbi:MAG: cyclic nucleotide-binding domain-containing protein [Magnetococcus sp. DMHC-6]
MLKLRIIDGLKFFEGLTAEEKEMVALLNLRIFKYDPHTLIIKEKAEDKNFYFLIKGTATVVSGTGKPLAILKTGDVFGEVAFLDATQNRTADVIANNEVIVMRVDKEPFQTLDPVIREKIKDRLIQVLVSRLVPVHENIDLGISSTFGWKAQ